MLKHKTLINFLLFVWALCVCRLAFAATFAQEVMAFDYQSLSVAAVGGLCGGALRTIFTLASDDRAVLSIIKESWKNLIISLMAGSFAYLLMILVASMYPNVITREFRFVAVLAAGWTRHEIFTRAGLYLRAVFNREQRKVESGKVEVPASAPVKLSDR